MHSLKQTYLIVLILLITVAMLLVACGDVLTATPIPTTTATVATTAPVTTASPTTVAKTTTAAPTTAPVPATAAPTATSIPATTTIAPTATSIPAVTTATGAGNAAFEPFVSQTGNFSVLLPFVPQELNYPYNLVTSDSMVDTHNFSDPKIGNSKIGYGVLYGDLTKDVETRLGVKGILDSAIYRFVQQSNLKLLSQKEITLGNVKGVEAEASHDDSYVLVRLFYANNRLYELFASGPPSLKDAPEINTFFDSFQIANVQPIVKATPLPPVAALPAAISPSLTEITVDQTVVAAFAKKLPKVSNLSVKWYVSNLAVDDLVKAADTNLLKAGYQFDIPGSSQPAKSGVDYAGIYARAGLPDLVVTFVPVSDDLNELSHNVKDLGLPGLDGLDYTKLAAQVKGQKSLVLIVTGNNLQHELLYDYGAEDSSSTPTPAS